MNEAYKGRFRSTRLDTRKGDVVLGIEDFKERLGRTPGKKEVEELAPKDMRLLMRLISITPSNDPIERRIWGYLTSIAAESSIDPLIVSGGDFAGLELAGGSIVIDCNINSARSRKVRPFDHIGERMSGGRLKVIGSAGDYIGQEMSGGGIIAGACRNYGFRNMHGGWGVIVGSVGDFFAVGNRSGRLVVKGDAGNRAGWLMQGGRLIIGGSAGGYLGLMMKGGQVSVGGSAGEDAGFRMRGGCIVAAGFGPDAGGERSGGIIRRRDP